MAVTASRLKSRAGSGRHHRRKVVVGRPASRTAGENLKRPMAVSGASAARRWLAMAARLSPSPTHCRAGTITAAGAYCVSGERIAATCSQARADIDTAFLAQEFSPWTHP